MKPHEDTWTTNANAEIRIENGTLIAGYLRPDVARLAAQAPAMARLLLDLHTEGHLTSTGSRECVSCASTWRERITGKPYEPRHYDSCELATVLRAAGVLP